MAVVQDIPVGAIIYLERGCRGLLDGKRATTHWYYLKELFAKHPAIRYVADRRIVVDEAVATTTGISAKRSRRLPRVTARARPSSWRCSSSTRPNHV
jgi:hypothetical protein